MEPALDKKSFIRIVTLSLLAIAAIAVFLFFFVKNYVEEPEYVPEEATSAVVSYFDGWL